jgi:hypothetical protein
MKCALGFRELASLVCSNETSESVTGDSVRRALGRSDETLESLYVWPRCLGEGE